MNEEKKKAIEKFIEKCNKYDESVEIKGVSIGEECRILDTVCKALILVEKLQKENEELRNKLSLKQFDINAVYNDYLEKLNEYKENSISIQKVKDIIDRIDYDIKKTKEIISKNTDIHASYRKNDYQIVRLRAMNTKSLDIKKRLQKLLESEE